MSALWAPISGWFDQAPADPLRLRALRSGAESSERMARFPFVMVLIAIFGVGMAGLLLLNTTLQGQAFESRTLNRQAAELSYVQTDLETQLDVLSTSHELARRASAIGMRPNPYPALLVAPSGKVIGKAQPVAGDEVPHLIVKTKAQRDAERATALARREAKAAEKAAAERAAAEAAAKKQAAALAEAKAEAARKAAEAAQKQAANAGVSKQAAGAAGKKSTKPAEGSKPERGSQG